MTRPIGTARVSILSDAPPVRVPDEPPPPDELDELRTRAEHLDGAAAFMVELAVGAVERSRRLCAELGAPWPGLGNGAADADRVEAFLSFYREQASLVAAMLPVGRGGRVQAVAVTVATPAAGHLLVHAARRRQPEAPVEGKEPESAPQPQGGPQPIARWG